MSLKEKLKHVIVEELKLEDITAEEIEDDTPLFGLELGLDSIDAVEIVYLVKKHFAVEIKDMKEGRSALQTINTLAALSKGAAPDSARAAPLRGMSPPSRWRRSWKRKDPVPV